MAAKSRQLIRSVFFVLCSVTIVGALNESPGLEISPNHEHQNAPQGQPYILTCRISLDNPSLLSGLRWIDNHGNEVTYGERMEVTSHEARITLQFIKPTADDSGLYICVASFQNSEKITAQVKITFYESITWDCCSTHPALIFGKAGQKIKSSPSITVSWKKDGKRLDDTRYIAGKHAIALKGEVQEDDAGMYEGESSVQSTEDLDIRTIKVGNHIEPKIEEFLIEAQSLDEAEKIGKRVGRRNPAGNSQTEFKPNILSKTDSSEMTWYNRPVNLTCVFSAVPNATVTWYKNGNPIDENELFRIYSDPISGYYILQIKPIERDVYGDYVCKAHNSRGNAWATIHLSESFVPKAPGRIEFRNSTPTALKFVISGVSLELQQYRLPIKGFILEYRKNDFTLDLPLQREYTENYAHENVLNNLLPSTEYVLRAALKNEVGIGDFSVEFPATTAAKTVPTVPKIIIDDSFETHTRGDIISDSDKSFVVKWLPSEDNGDPIKAYKIRYCMVVHNNGWRIKDGSRMELSVAEPTASSYTLKYLEPSSIYKAELTAHNTLGSSGPSVIVFKTKGSASATKAYPSAHEHPSSSSSSVALMIVIILITVIVILLIIDILFYVHCQVGLSYFIRKQLRGTQFSSDTKRKVDEVGAGHGFTEMPNEEITQMMLNGSHERVGEAQSKPVKSKDSQV